MPHDALRDAGDLDAAADVDAVRAGAVLARELADPRVGAERGERVPDPPRLLLEARLQARGRVRLVRDVLEHHAALVEYGHVPADGAHERRQPALARDRARPPKPGRRVSSRPNAAVGPGLKIRSAGARRPLATSASSACEIAMSRTGSAGNAAVMSSAALNPPAGTRP